MKYIYAAEKLSSAVLYAMRSEERLQERLAGCYVIFHTLSHNDYLPPDLRKRFDAMINAWTRLPDHSGMRGTVAVTTAQMGHDEAYKWLEEVFSLCAEIERREALENEKVLQARA